MPASIAVLGFGAEPGGVAGYGEFAIPSLWPGRLGTMRTDRGRLVTAVWHVRRCIL